MALLTILTVILLLIITVIGAAILLGLIALGVWIVKAVYRWVGRIIDHEK